MYSCVCLAGKLLFPDILRLKLERKVALCVTNKIGCHLPGEMLLRDKFPTFYFRPDFYSFCALQQEAKLVSHLGICTERVCVDLDTNYGWRQVPGGYEAEKVAGTTRLYSTYPQDLSSSFHTQVKMNAATLKSRGFNVDCTNGEISITTEYPDTEEINWTKAREFLTLQRVRHRRLPRHHAHESVQESNDESRDESTVSLRIL